MGKEIAVNETEDFRSLIQAFATNPSVDTNKLQALLDMQERVLDRGARQAFASAFANMQEHLPEIKERGKSHNGKYATLEDINDAIKPVLSEYGFGLAFRVNQTADSIKVTGILSHREGHSEETEMSVPADNSGSKNAVQAIGSSVSYAKRYVLCALLNISTRGEDDNAGKADPNPTEPQLESIKKLLLSATDKAREDFTAKYVSLENVKRGQVDSLIAWLKKHQVKA